MSSTMFMRFKPFKASLTYKFKDPDTGHEYTGKNKQDLINKIGSYRAQNRLKPIEALDAVLENYLCNLPENMGLCEPNKVLRRGFLPTIRGGIALLENIMYQRFATQATADERADQCSKCPHNYFPDKSKFLEYSDQIAEAATGGKRSKFHNLLGNCEVCTCPLRAKVFYDGKVTLTPDEVKAMEKVNCWQLKLR